MAWSGALPTIEEGFLDLVPMGIYDDIGWHSSVLPSLPPFSSLAPLIALPSYSDPPWVYLKLRLGVRIPSLHPRASSPRLHLSLSINRLLLSSTLLWLIIHSAPPWLVITLVVSWTSAPPAMPPPFTPSTPSGSSFPLAPPLSSLPSPQSAKPQIHVASLFLWLLIDYLIMFTCFFLLVWYILPTFQFLFFGSHLHYVWFVLLLLFSKQSPECFVLFSKEFIFWKTPFVFIVCVGNDSQLTLILNSYLQSTLNITKPSENCCSFMFHGALEIPKFMIDTLFFNLEPSLW